MSAPRHVTNLFGALLALAALPLAAAPFTPGNVVVYRVGAGGGALVNTGNAVFLDEFAPDGSRVQSIALPVAASGTNQPLIASGTATSEGLLARSADGRHLVLTGYGRAPGGGDSLSGTSATAVNRVVGRVDADGVVDTSTALTDYASANNPRSATSTDGSSFWVAGGAGGVRLAVLGATSSTAVSTTVANLRQLALFDGQLYTSTGSGSAVRIGTVGNGAPTDAGNPITTLPGLPVSTGSPYAFALLDLDPAELGVDTLYVADDGIGLLKYAKVAGTWVARGSVGSASDAYRGLVAAADGGAVTLYATRKGGSGAAGGGELVRLLDTSGYNGTLAGSPVVLATAATQTAFRGIAFAPVRPSTPPDVVVYRVGSGSGNLVNTGNPVFLDQYAADGSAVRSVAVPSSVAGTNQPLVASGTATSEGQLSRSADGRYVLLTGYGRAPGGSGSLSGTASSAVPRVVGRMNADGVVNTRSAFTDFSDGNNPRSATSRDGTDLWLAGGAGGVRYAAFGSTTSAQLSTTLTNLRQVQIFDGQLYAATTSGSAIRVGTVGSGMPTTAGQTIANLPGVPTSISPFSFVLLDLDADVAGPDTLYVADDGAGLLKFSRVGSSWVANGSVGNGADAYRSVTGAVVDGRAVLYATRKGGDAAIGGGELVRVDDAGGYNGAFAGAPQLLATAAPNTALRGVALAPLPGGDGEDPLPPAPHVDGLPAAYSGVVGDATDVAATTGITFTVGDDATAACDISVSASSDNPAVVSAADLALGACDDGRYSLRVTPRAAGFANLSIEAVNATQGRSTQTLRFAASTAWVAPASLGTIWPSGTSDGSTAQALDEDSYIDGADESQVLRVYSRQRSGEPLAGFDVRAALELPEADPTREVDIEASAKVGNRIYWAASHTNSSSGALRPNRWRIFATDVTGAGASTHLAFVGYYGHLRDDLIAWDQANGDRFGFAASAAVGIEPKRIDGFNIEGLSFSPDGSVAWLAFRAPLLPVSARGKALLVPVTNFAALASGALGHAAGQAQFGEPILLDLGHRGFREIQCNASGCLIVAGAVDGTPNGRLFTWSGDPADAPVERDANLSGLNIEGVVALPAGALGDDSLLELVSDNGTTDYYGTGQESKDLAYDAWKKFRVDRVRLGSGIGTAPTPFAFAPVVGAQRASVAESADITVAGLLHPAPVTITVCTASACEYAVNDGTWSATAGQVVAGDRVRVRQITASAFATTTTLTLSIGGVAGDFTATTVGAPAALSRLGGDAQQATVGSAFAEPLALRVVDAADQPVGGVAVTFEAPASGASASLTSGVTTAADGSASGTAIANTVAGDYRVVAHVDGLAATVDYALENRAGPIATISKAGGDNQSARVGTAFADALQVRVSDAYDNPIEGAAVTFSAPTSGAGAVLATPSASTAADGTAATSAQANASVGPYAVQASAGAFSTTFALENTAPVVALHAMLTSAPPYLRYGQTLDYRLVVRNDGPDTAHAVAATFVFGAALDGDAASWLCNASDGASCVTDGSGAALDPQATIPAGATLSYVVSVASTLDAVADPVLSTVSLRATEAPDPIMVSDAAPPRLVVFREGFEDGSAVETGDVLDDTTTHAFVVGAGLSPFGIDTVLLGTGDGDLLRVERIAVGLESYVRLVHRDRDGAESRSAALDVHVGETLMLGFSGTGDDRHVLLATHRGVADLAVGATMRYRLAAGAR